MEPKYGSRLRKNQTWMVARGYFDLISKQKYFWRGAVCCVQSQKAANSREIMLPCEWEFWNSNSTKYLLFLLITHLGPNRVLVYCCTKVHKYYNFQPVPKTLQQKASRPTFLPSSLYRLNLQLCWYPSQQNGFERKTDLGKIVSSVEVHVETQTKETSVKHKQEFNFQNLVGCK